VPKEKCAAPYHPSGVAQGCFGKNPSALGARVGFRCAGFDSGKIPARMSSIHRRVSHRFPGLGISVDRRAATPLSPPSLGHWRGGRVVECARLESAYTARYRGFESPPLRHFARRSAGVARSETKRGYGQIRRIWGEALSEANWVLRSDRHMASRRLLRCPR
jgi:hypothetical protein